MKIWIVEISDFLPEIENGNRLYRAGMLANALVKDGHDVIWWSSTFNHQLRKQRYKVTTQIKIKNNYHLGLLYGPGYSRSVSIRRWLHNRAVAKEFAKETSTKSNDELPDLIYACYPTIEVSEQAVRFGVRNDIPVIVDIRELLPDNYLTIFPYFLKPIIRVAIHAEFLRAKYVLKHAKAITGSSEAYVNWGLRFAKRIPNSTDKWFPLGITKPVKEPLNQDEIDSLSLAHDAIFDRKNLIITFVGTFTNHYDFKTIFKVARELLVSGDQQIQFLFIGDGDHFSDIKKISMHQKNIHLTGWCKKPLVDKILSLSSIGIAPYSFSFTPTLPNKPLEYMASGLPLLSSLGGELKSIIEKESIGLQYVASDSNELKNKIEWFFSHPEEMRAMGHRAKQLFRKKYDADVVYPNLVTHLTKIANMRVTDK